MRSLVLALLSLLFAFSPAAGEITGKRPSVIDGKTIVLAGARIRLFGIDAPETGQTCRAGGQPWNCGMEARWATANRIGMNWVACQPRSQDPSGAIVAVCYLGGIGGPELNAWLVAQGWALAYRPESLDYVAEEETARRSRKGLWRGEFEAPWVWRARQ